MNEKSPLASFVPAAVVRRYGDSAVPPSQPASQSLSAAVLLADISGFTPLAERMALLGPRGAEKLTERLNDYFGRLIEVVTAHGGEVVGFAGDALLALWAAEAPSSDGLSRAVVRAGQCGLAVQEALASFAADADAPLTLVTGMSAGEVTLMFLGGTGGRWELLVAGSPLAQMAEASREAEAGEIVLSAEAWAQVAERCKGMPRGGRCVRLEAVLEPIEVVAVSPPSELRADAGVAAFVPPAVKERMAAGQTEWLSELRRVTVLFVSLPDPAGQGTGALHRTQQVFLSVQEVVERHEGTINKLAVDDKGLFMLAVFGLPPLAHTDDAARGVRAAMALRRELVELGVNTGIGIATGRVFCGVVGSPIRREYTVIGDTVNLAARLMQLSGGGILCDATTTESAAAQVDFEEKLPLRVKGKREPVAVFAPTSGAARVAQRAPLVGRHKELEVLSSCLDALRAGTPCAVMLEGGTGAGKTRLLMELSRMASEAGVPCLEGAADSVVRGAPYHAWRPVVEKQLGLNRLESADRKARRMHVEHLLAGDALFESLGPLLSDLVELDLADNPLTAAMSGEVRAHNTQDLLVHLLSKPLGQSAAGSVRVIILDDVQWLDSASWALLRQVRKASAPLLVVVAARPSGELEMTDWDAFKSMPGVCFVPLLPLTSEETADLIRQRLGRTASEDVVRLVHERAEGNPFFTEELALTLLEAGATEVRDGMLHLAPAAGDRLAIPDTVQGTVLARLDRLDPRQQLIVKVASVIGRTFAYNLLSEVYPVATDRPRLTQKLSELETVDLLFRQSQEPELVYLHRHETIREVAYGLLLYEQRRRLHRAVAEAIEAGGGESLAPYYPRLAYHWARAEVVDKTLFYLEKAGERALLEGAYREAADCFREALSLVAGGGATAEPRQRAHWLRLLGEAHLGLGDLPASRASLEQSVALLGLPVPSSKAGMAVGLLGAIFRQLANRFLPWPRIAAGPEKARSTEAALAYLRLLETYFFLAGPADSFFAVLQALNAAERAGPGPELARSMVLTGWMFSLVPAFGLADRYLRRAAALVATPVGAPAVQPVRFFTGFVRIAQGRWEEGSVALEESVGIARKLGDKRRLIEGVCAFSTLMHYRGQYERRVQMGADVLYASARRQGDFQAEAWGLLDQAESLLTLGRQERAMELLTAAAPFMEKEIGKSELVWGHGLSALVHLRAGNRDKAFAEAVAATRVATSMAPVAAYCYEGYAGAAEALLSLAEELRSSPVAAGGPVPEGAGLSPASRGQVPRLATQACRALAEYARVFPFARPRAALCSGTLAWLAGKREKARRLWSRGLEAATALKMPYEEARLVHVLARHLPPSDPERARKLSLAAEGFERLHAGHDLVLVQRDLS